MAGIIKRFSDIMSANLNALLDWMSVMLILKRCSAMQKKQL